MIGDPHGIRTPQMRVVATETNYSDRLTDICSGAAASQEKPAPSASGLVCGRAGKKTRDVRARSYGAIRPPRALACNGGALLSKVRRATLRHDTAENQQDCVTG